MEKLKLESVENCLGVAVYKMPSAIHRKFISPKFYLQLLKHQEDVEKITTQKTHRENAYKMDLKGKKRMHIGKHTQ